MTHYVSCSHCNGDGFFSCNDCCCQKCKTKGKINCTNCTGGYIPCVLCNSTGQIPKKRLFFSSSEICPDCKGVRKLDCPVCNSSGLLICDQCNGTGRNTSCSNCGGTRRIQCSICGGVGEIEDQWYESLHSLPVNQLYFEHEKRQRKIQRLEVKISNLSRECDEMYRAVERWKREHPLWYRNVGSYPSELETIETISQEIRQLEDWINELENQMTAIEKVLDTKQK